MRKLINFEFRKLFKSKSFYICLCICVGLVLLGGLTTKVLFENSDGQMASPSGLSMLKSAIGSASITLISGIFVALFVCEDNTFGTIKNIYAKGYSRKNVYFSKYIVSLSAILIFTLISMVVAFLFGSSTWKVEEAINGNYILTMLGQLVLVAAYHAIYFAISSKIGKTGSSIAFNIVGPMLVAMVLSMADALLKIDNFKLTSYWLDSLLSPLQQTEVLTNSISTAIIFGIIYLVVFICGGLFLNKRNEL